MFGELVESHRVNGLVEFGPAIYEVNQILSVKRLVSYLGGDVFVHLLYVRHAVDVISLRLMNEAMQTVINSSHGFVNYCYKDVKAGFGVVTAARWGCWGAVMTASSMMPAHFLASTDIIKDDNPLIQ